MSIYEKITAAAALVAFAACCVAFLASLLGVHQAWRHRRTEAAMRRARQGLLRDYWTSRSNA